MGASIITFKLSEAIRGTCIHEALANFLDVGQIVQFETFIGTPLT
jgi:hypothetical protein